MMRLFFLSFVGAWGAGIGLGVVFASYVVLGYALLGFLLVFHRIRFVYGVVVLALFMLGFVYGVSTVRAGGDQSACDGGTILDEGVVERVDAVGPSRATYVVTMPHGCTLLLTTSRYPVYGQGDIVFIEGEIQLLDEFPREYKSYAEYLERRGIGGTMRFPEDVRLSKRTNSAFADVRAYVRERIAATFVQPEAGLLQAMILADRGGLHEDVEAQFRATGVSHIMAISGLHISILSGIALALVSMIPVAPAKRAFGVIVFLWLYVLLVGLPVSAVRAAVFWTIGIAAYQLRWLVSLPTVLVAALVTLVTVQPDIMLTVGFQLSFAAVAGIGAVLFLVRSLPRRLREISWSDSVYVSLGAFLTTAPLIAYHFGTFTLHSVPVNVLVVPVVPVFIIFSFLSLVAGIGVPFLAVALSYVVHVVWVWIDSVTSTAAVLPVGYWDDVQVSVLSVSIYYAVLVGIFFVVLRTQGRSLREIWQ